jgi:hypothetical protein
MANEKRLIDADALNRALIEEYHGMLSDETLKIYQVIRILDECPTVDAVEVVHGRWDRSGYCTVCDFWTCYCNDYQYCPNCGAKMRGDSE